MSQTEDDLRAENRRLYEQNVRLRQDIEGAMMGREAMERTRDSVRERDLAKIAELRAALADALNRLASWVSDEPHPERPDSRTDAEIYDQEKIAELRKRFDLK